MNEDVMLWYKIAMTAVAVPATIYPFLYTAWFKWWDSMLGRALFTKSVALAIVIDLSLAGVVWQWYYPKLSIGLLFLLAVALVFQQYAMLRVKLSSSKHGLAGVSERDDEQNRTED